MAQLLLHFELMMFFRNVEMGPERQRPVCLAPWNRRLAMLVRAGAVLVVIGSVAQGCMERQPREQRSVAGTESCATEGSNGGGVCALCDGSGGTCPIPPEFNSVEDGLWVQAYTCDNSCEGAIVVFDPKTGEERWFVTPGFDSGSGGCTQEQVSAADAVEHEQRIVAGDSLRQTMTKVGTSSQQRRTVACAGWDKLPKCVAALAKFFTRNADEVDDAVRAASRGGRIISSSADEVSRAIGYAVRKWDELMQMQERAANLARQMERTILKPDLCKLGKNGDQIYAKVPLGTKWEDWKLLNEMPAKLDDIVNEIDELVDAVAESGRKMTPKQIAKMTELKQALETQRQLISAAQDRIIKALDITGESGQCDLVKVGTIDDFPGAEFVPPF